MGETPLTSKNVTQLDGNPIRLSSPYADGRLLTISPAGEVTSEPPETGFDQYWRFIPVSEGFLLSSSKNRDIVCHHMTDGGSIISKPLSDNIKDCIWKISGRGEIYQPNPDGGERYLWLANDRLYATLDGFLAENWILLSDNEHSPIPSKSEDENSILTYFIIIMVLVTVLVVSGLYLLKSRWK